MSPGLFHETCFEMYVFRKERERERGRREIERERKKEREREIERKYAEEG